MAALDFPASPTLGQQYTAAGVTWTWDGAKWAASGLSVAYLALAGGTMSGPIVLAADPAAAMQAATRQYVDAQIGALVPAMNDNRIINGDMRIDQRGVASGAGGTAQGYTVDRWQYVNTSAPTGRGTWARLVAGGTLLNVGFGYYLAFTSSGAYAAAAADQFIFYQPIEADMVGDFAWGTSGAQPVTLSFWVACSLTGTFGGSLRNYPTNNRSYPFSFNIPVATTWTKIIVTIPGDTAGTWALTGNGGGLSLSFDLGSGANFRGAANAWNSTSNAGVTGAVSIVGTNGATINFAGVKLEVGTVATPYNRQSLTKSLADCQRYYQVMTQIIVSGYSGAASGPLYETIPYNVQMRATPTGTISGISYVNASNLVANMFYINDIMMTVTATAAGFAYGIGTLLLSAEL